MTLARQGQVADDPVAVGFEHHSLDARLHAGKVIGTPASAP
jgi:hypothetical protein